MRAAAEKAIQLDPLLPEAHGVMGLVYAGDLAWDDAERSFQRALELNPNLAGVHVGYGMFVLQPEGKVAEAVQQYREALTLDPLSDRSLLAFGLITAGAYDEALEICRGMMATDPDDDCARAMWFKGRHEEAIAILEKLDPSNRGFLGYMYGSIGRRREAEQIAAEQDPAAIRHQAFVYAGLGEKDRVLEAFKRMAAMHDHIVDIYPVWPEFALMRDDPRMKEFRRKRNLPWPPAVSTIRK
jgi:tetratricopeptide (TPR) repeat protein